MKHIKIFLLSLASSFGALAADIDVTPGQLESLLGDGGKGQEELVIRGKIDARDLATLENLSSDVKKLDLSKVSIEALTMPTRKYFGRTLFNEDEIPAYTFFKSGVTTLILPDDVTSICEGAFAGSAITEISIPEGVTAIGDYAFYGCQALEKVILPKSLTTIGKGVFGNCNSLKSIDLSSTQLTAIPERAFAGSMSLIEIKLPASVKSVGREAFSHTSIEVLNLSNVIKFEEYALSSMPFLTELSINPNAEMKEGLLMNDTSLYSLTGVPEMVPDYFAANCGALETSKLNDAESLGKYSFANTLAPETLYLPSSLASIDRGALSGLGNIKTIDVTELGNDVPAVDKYSFEGLNQLEIILWVDDKAFDKWNDDPVWGLFKVMSQNQTGVDELPADAKSNIYIACSNNLLLIESAAIVNDVRIYTADGRMAYVASPGQNRVEIDTASLPSGIVIVAVSDENGNARTVSLLLK